jgi:hypothetical protein
VLVGYCCKSKVQRRYRNIHLAGHHSFVYHCSRGSYEDRPMLCYIKTFLHEGISAFKGWLYLGWNLNASPEFVELVLYTWTNKTSTIFFQVWQYDTLTGEETSTLHHTLFRYSRWPLLLWGWMIWVLLSSHKAHSFFHRSPPAFPHLLCTAFAKRSQILKRLRALEAWVWEVVMQENFWKIEVKRCPGGNQKASWRKMI